jgi:MFS family permease
VVTDLDRTGSTQPSTRGRRRAGPGGLRRAGRLRELLISGVVDSFGMALGWTVLVLLALNRGGLAEAALYNAAMLVGVVLSAPVTGWLSRRLSGSTLLRGAAGIEFVLRFGVLFGLIVGMPPWLVATGVVIMHVAAWAGFAGMRAEVNAVDASPRAMTRYALSIAAVEAAGTGLGALLPSGPDGYPTGWPLIVVFVIYTGSLLPTYLSAQRARITSHLKRPVKIGLTIGYGVARASVSFPNHRPAGARHTAEHARRRALPVSPKLLFAGGAIMLLASGPTLLAIPLTTELHGRTWVAGAAVAFSIGCLLSTIAVESIRKMQLPAVLRWSLWGLGMLVGWIYAPLHAVTILFAQFLAGISQTAFEGDMDAAVAAEAPPEGITTALAYSASTRALGGSIAVRLLPMMVTAQAIGQAVSASVLVLGVAALVIWAATLLPRLTGRNPGIRLTTPEPAARLVR